MIKQSSTKAAADLINTINSYLFGTVNREDFSAAYNAVLAVYEEEIGEKAYHPIDIIIPSDKNSEKAWKLQFIKRYKAEIASIEAALESPEKSYSESLTEDNLKKLCQNAISVINRQMADLSAKKWIEDNIVNEVYFEFFKEDGSSKLGSHQILYRTPISNESFLLSALDNLIQPSSISLAKVLNVLKEYLGTESAVWAKCTSPDGAIASINIRTSSVDPLSEIRRFTFLERESSQSVQGCGVLDLILLPSDRSWILRGCNTFEEFFVELHGKDDLIKQVIDRGSHT